MAKENTEILLESGTNEVEIMEFFLGEQRFGINVAKLKTVLQFDPALVTPLPVDMASFMGVYRVRGRTIPLIDLADNLGRPKLEENPRRIVLVTEFNNMLNCFLVDGVHRIRRVFWKDINPIPTFLSQYNARLTGTVQIDGSEILLVDLEHIIAKIFPESALDVTPIMAAAPQAKRGRGDVRILLAEDSSIIRALLTRTLSSAGYTQLTSFANGKAALDAVVIAKQKAASEGRPITTFINLIISDIEMPEMDGLTFCRKVKADLAITDVPFFIFSSLINEQMILKCREVGADGWITKPQIATLVQLVDGRLLG